jgi:RecA-family ATPase
VTPQLPPSIETVYQNGAEEGTRNTQLFKIACQFRDQGMSYDAAETEAESWAFKVGLSQKEAMSAVKSAYSRPAREPWVPAAKWKTKGLQIYREEVAIPPMPKSVEETPVEKFLAVAFEVGDRINICRSILDGDRERPDGAGETKTREEWIELFRDEGLKKWQGTAVGVYVAINPTKTNSRQAKDISKWRHCLVEFDESTIEEQWAILKKAGLPTSCIIRSGGRSLHGWVKVEAQSETEFRDRVDFIYKHLAHAKPDPANKDPGRLSRLPGAIRTATGQPQELVECGAPTRTFLEWKEWTIYGDIPEPFKWDDLLTFKEEADKTTLLGRRWLCRGGSVLWVGSSGLGKSVLCLQAAITWAIGRSFFGITPTGDGLRSLILQAENDEGDVAEACQGVVKSMNLSPKEMDLVRKNVIIVRDCTSTGEVFIDKARRLADKHKPDLFWADPLFAYVGGDLSDQETASRFLRNMLNPLALSASFSWMLIHHTPKPMRDGTSYQGHDKAYSGFGSSELTNWARAVVVLAPCGQDEEGVPVYKLEVSKRGKRSGLAQSHDVGGVTAQKASVHPHVFLRHSDHGLAWMEAGEPEKGKPGPRRAEINWDKAPLTKSYGDIIAWIQKEAGLGERQAKSRYKEYCEQKQGQNDTEGDKNEPF